MMRIADLQRLMERQEQQIRKKGKDALDETSKKRLEDEIEAVKKKIKKMYKRDLESLNPKLQLNADTMRLYGRLLQ